MQKSLEKTSLLSVSLLVNSAGAILSSLPLLTDEFNQVNPTLIEILSTLPSLLVMLTVPFSPRLAKKIGYKRTIQMGMLFCLFGGLLPIFTRSFSWLFVSRIIFGIGLGLFNPLLFSFSSARYQGKELSDMIGFQSAFEGIGGILVSFTVAQLVLSGWRNTLWVYLIILPIFLAFTLFVSDIKVKENKALPPKTLQKGAFDLAFIRYVVLLMLLITIYTSVSVKLTAHLLEAGYGDAKDASNALALMGLGAMLAGFLFGKLRVLFKQWLLPLSFASLSLSLVGLALTRQVYLMIFFVFWIGLSFRTFVPYLLDKANQVTDGSGERRTSMLLMGFNIGLAMAPVSLRLLQASLRLETVTEVFLTEATIVAMIALGACFLNWKRIRK